MHKSVAILLIVMLSMPGCTEGYSEGDYEAGRNGEPPKALEQSKLYTHQFASERKNYVLALGQIHAFLIANHFSVTYTSCFNHVLHVRVAAIRKKRFPCVALQAKQGAPTKVYLSVTIDDVLFNQLDHDNRLIYTVSMFGREGLAEAFTSDVAPKLQELYENTPSEEKLDTK